MSGDELNEIIDNVCDHVNAECDSGCGTKARNLLQVAIQRHEIEQLKWTEDESIPAALTQAAPGWTTQKPTVPGWYWYREGMLGPEVIGVYAPNGPDTEYLEAHDTPLTEFTGEWSGPLEPPGELA